MTDCVICQERPRHPDLGQVDPLCWGRLHGRLRMIPDLWIELVNPHVVVDDRKRKSGAPADPVAWLLPAGPLNAPRSGPRVSGSTTPPVPVSVDAVDLSGGPVVPSLTAHGLRWLTDQVGHLSAATVLDGWVKDWASRRGENLPAPTVPNLPAPTVPNLAAWLDVRLDWACRDHDGEALAAFADEIQRLHVALLAVTGHLAPRPEPLVAPCRSCYTLALYRDVESGYVACAACSALLTEAEYAEHCCDLATTRQRLTDNPA